MTAVADSPWPYRGPTLSLFVALAVLPATGAFAQATIDDADATAAEIGARLQGTGVTIANPSIPLANGSDDARMYGLFSNGVGGAALEIAAGAALSTGRIADMFTSNDEPDNSRGGLIVYSDPDLIILDAGAVFNVAVITMDVTLDAYATGFSLRYQFGSEEYPDYVGSLFNDLMAILVSGPGIIGKPNIALAPTGNATDINTVNFGVRGCWQSGAPVTLTNSASYIANGHTTALPATCNPDPQPGPFLAHMEWNGFTRALTAQRTDLTPGATYQLKIAVADVGDPYYDSGVIIEAISATYGRDYGDAPLSYGAPSHVVRSAHRLGAGVTREAAGYNDPNAAGDANDDGVVPPSLTQGQTSTIEVSIAGSGGYLQAFADWNDDGDFNDPAERIATNVEDGGTGDSDGAANGAIALSVTPPITVALSPTIARFRWSTQSGLDATADAVDGEVEDYELTVAPGDSTLNAEKTVALHDPGAVGLYATPGTDVIYRIEVFNAGNVPIDSDSLFVVDKLPPQIEFFNGPTPEFGGEAVGWTESGSMLTFSPSTDLRFSNLSARPANFAACAYSPVAGYDPAVTYVCLNPKGELPAGDPDPGFSFRIRARIK